MGALLLYVVSAVISGAILFAIIRAAVLSALDEHYKTVRWFEHTGEWTGKHAPRSFDTTGSGAAPTD